MPVRRSWRFLLVCVPALLLAGGLAACHGSADDEPPAAATETAPQAAVPAAPSPAETPQPHAAPEAPLPEPPAEPVEPDAPAASLPTDDPTAPASEEAPAPVAEPTPLRYDTYDLSGVVAEPGHYAFLADPDDPTSVVTTYEGLRNGTATALLVHKADGYGASQAALYDAVESGDLMEWRQAADCFVRYQMTEVKPDPTGTAPQKLLGVAWMTYAFMGCSGTVATTTAATLDWGDLPDLGGTSLTTPIRHGIFQVIPEGWTGPLDPGETHTLPEGAPAYPGPVARTDDVAVARGYPYWREPVLPAGWTFSFAYTGGLEVSYGYCASYDAADGYVNVEICGDALVVGSGTVRMLASWLADGGSDGMRAGASETRWISGRPAVVRYSPAGPLHDRLMSGRVLVHDVATQSIYKVIGVDPSLRGSNIEDVIAIARSLFENPPRLFYDTYDLSGAVTEPGHYAFLADPDDPTSVVTTYEELRDGTATALLVHTHDAHGISRTDLYAAVEPGDLFEWRQAADCFVRYQVTEVKPDPTGLVPQKLLGVAWMTYAFTGCSGPIATTTAATLDWGDLPALGGTRLTAPVIHGSYQLVPEDWSGATEPGQVHRPPGVSPGPFMGRLGTETDDLTVARAHPYWREPVLPAGWDFQIAVTGGYETTPVGYCALYGSAAGFTSIVICGDYAFGQRFPAEASWIANQQDPSDWRQGVLETRVIAGRPARVQYSPLGTNHSITMPTRVLIYDPATNIQYDIFPRNSTLRGANIDAVIAIARSLFEPPNAP